MSHQGKLRRMFSVDRLDLLVAKVGVVLCVLLLGLRLLTSQVLILVIPLATGAACALYLGIQNRRSTAYEFPTLPRGVIGFLPSIVFVGLAALVMLTFAAGQRTVPIYLLTGAIGSVILAQTLLIDDGDLAPGLVLAQILVAAVVIRLTALFVTPGFIGVDVWTHVPVFIEGIVEAESLSGLSGSKYIMAPFYHTIGAVAALVFGSARVGVYLTMGLLVPLSALLVYTAGRLVVPVRWALVATALYAFADQFIQWGIHIIPTSLGLVFFLAALYCVTRLFYTDEPSMVVLLLVFSLAMVFTHQVSTAILLVFLGVASASVLAARTFGSRTERVPTRTAVGLVGTFLITLVSTVASWMITPWQSDGSFLVQMIGILEGTVVGEAGFLNLAGTSGGGGGAAGNGGMIAEVLPFIEWFGFALLLLSVVVGGLAMLRMKNPPGVTFTYLVSGATMFVIIFGFSLFGIRDILPGRWLGFMYAVFAIVGAVGLHYVSRNASSRVILAVFIIIAVGYPATMVVSEKATMDNPAFESEHPRMSFTESEIAAVETISTVYPPEAEKRVLTDHPFQSLFGRYGGYTSRVVVLEESGAESSHPAIYREYQTESATQLQVAGEPPVTVPSRTIEPGRVCPSQRNHVYANDEVKMCSTPGGVPGVSA